MRSRRWIALALPALLVLAACGQDGDSTENGGDGGSTEEQAQAVDVPADGEWVGDLSVYIPATPGGGFDIAVRTLQPHLEEVLGVSVIPTNMEGAGGAIAAQDMLSKPADGTSMMIVSRSISALPYTGSPEIDPVEDFKALGVTHQDVSALSVPADAPYQTVDEFIEYAREHPGEITIGHSGVGGVWHAAALMLARETGVEFSFVPYDGGSAVGAALLAGEIDAMTIGAPESRPFIEGGEAKMLAVMGEERSSLYPDVPTLKELGIDVVYAVWRGYVTSAETPEEIRMALAERLEAAANSQGNQEAMTEAGFETTWIGPEEFQQLIEEEDELFRELFEGEDFVTSMPDRLGG